MQFARAPWILLQSEVYSAQPFFAASLCQSLLRSLEPGWQESREQRMNRKNPAVRWTPQRLLPRLRSLDCSRAVSVPVLRSLVNGSGGPPAAFSFSWPPACAFILDAHARICVCALDTGCLRPDGGLGFLSHGFSLLFLILMKVFRSAEHGNFGGPTFFFRQSISASIWALRGRVAV